MAFLELGELSINLLIQSSLNMVNLKAHLCRLSLELADPSLQLADSLDHVCLELAYPLVHVCFELAHPSLELAYPLVHVCFELAVLQVQTGVVLIIFLLNLLEE